MTAAVLEKTDLSAPRLSTSSEFVAAAGQATVAMGERLNLYEQMGNGGSVTSVELALATRLPVWFTEGWLEAQVNAGYAVQETETGRYSLSCRI